MVISFWNHVFQDLYIQVKSLSVFFIRNYEIELQILCILYLLKSFSAINLMQRVK